MRYKELKQAEYIGNDGGWTAVIEIDNKAYDLFISEDWHEDTLMYGNALVHFTASNYTRMYDANESYRMAEKPWSYGDKALEWLLYKCESQSLSTIEEVIELLSVWKVTVTDHNPEKD